jgi:hypothetical protein
MSHKIKKKKAAVRMLERAVKEISHLDSNISLVVAGSDAGSWQHRLRNLNRLAEDDPNNLFWDRLQKTVLKILKHLVKRR